MNKPERCIQCGEVDCGCVIEADDRRENRAYWRGESQPPQHLGFDDKIGVAVSATRSRRWAMLDRAARARAAGIRLQEE